jgi:hypothetical protein
MKRKLIPLFLILTITFFANPSFAIIKNLSFFGGYTSFSENFKPSAKYGAALDLITADGIGFHVSSAYIKTQSESSDYSDLKFVPLMAGITYHFFPFRQMSPYISALVCMNLTSQYMESPISGYAVKTGFFFRMDKYSGIFVEAEKQFAKDSKTDIQLDPFSINAGITLTLWGLEPGDDNRYDNYQKELNSRRSMRKLRKKRLIEEELEFD